MKLIISSLILTTLAHCTRLLQQIDACSTVRCGADGRTECVVNPVNTDIAVCCAPDDLCSDADYQSTDVAICMEDGGLQKYDNKCLGRCDGNKACGQLCTCDTDADCAAGYSCLETPFGFGGCDENVGNSCYGFCTIERRGACGGFVGPAGCNADEACFLYSTESNSLGSCYSLPDTCVEIPTCGGFEYCASYNEDCNTCRCSPGSDLAGCTKIGCDDNNPIKNQCQSCIDGFVLNENNECEPDLGCICPAVFQPVCCGGTTYGNACEAGCAGCNEPTSDGPCPTTCCPPLDPADVLTTCGFEGCECCPDGTWSGSIGDGDTFCGGLKKSAGDIFGEVCDSTPTTTASCCDPQVIIDFPGLCREGCQCCPDGTWSGSIGDGDTFCGGLKVSEGDIFGEVCEDDDGDVKECTSNGSNSECSRGYKCRPNPNCRGKGRCDPRRVCVDVATGFCSDDSECDTANGYSCIGNRPNGKGYGSGNGNCIKFEDP